MRSTLSLVTVLVPATAIAIWVGCGGSTPTPVSVGKPDPSTAEAASKDPDISGANLGAASKSAEPVDTTPPPPPPPPKFSEGDCGQCVAKTCEKQAKACGDNADCKTNLDAINGCPQDKAAMMECVGKIEQPTDKKVKKLAKDFSTCMDKAIKTGGCKDKCK